MTMPPASAPAAVVRRYYETHDPALLAETIEWHVLPSWPGGGRYRGRSGVEHFFAAVMAHFTEYGAYPEEIWDTTGGVVIARGDYRGRVQPGAPPFAVSFVHIWTVRDGRITRLDQVADSAAMCAALEEAGSQLRASAA
jgi:ketosteroid isomerase-like protein